MLLRSIFCFLILVISNSVHAECDFAIDFEVESTSLLKILPGQGRYRGQLRLEWRQSLPQLPHWSLTFDDLEKATTLQLSFLDPKINKREGSAFYPPDYQADMELLSQQNFQMERSDSILTAKAWGYKKNQVFMSLFMSQNFMNLQVLDEQSEVIAEGQISLKGTDLGIRRIATQCFPEASADYLKGTQRLQEVALSWQNSYGLLNLDDLDLLTDNQKNMSFEGNEENFAALSLQLQKEQQIAKDFQDIKISYFDDSVFLKVLETKMALGKLALELDRFITPGGSRDRLLEQLDWLFKSRDFLQKSLIEMQTLSTDLHGQQSRADSELKMISDKLKDLQDKLDLLRIQLTNVKDQQVQLQVIASQKDVDLSTLPLPTDLATPIDFTSVLTSADQIDRLKKSQLLALNYESFLVSIQEQMQSLQSLSTEMNQQYTQLLDQKAEQTKLEEEVNSLADLNKIYQDQYYSLTPSQIRGHLQKFDATRVWDRQKLLDNVKESYQIHDSLVEQNLSEQALKDIICQTDSFKRDYNGTCLQPFELESNAAVTRFLTGLAGEDLRKIEQALKGHHQDFVGQNLSESLTIEWLIFVTSLNLEQIKTSWENCLMARWMYFMARDNGVAEVNRDQLADFLLKIDQEIMLNQNKILQINQQIADAVQNYEVNLAVFNIKKQNFYSQVEATRSEILSLFELNAEQFPAEAIPTCEINEPVLVLCLEPLNQNIAELREQEKDLESQIQALFADFQSMVQRLNAQLVNSIAELEDNIQLSNQDLENRKKELEFDAKVSNQQVLLATIQNLEEQESNTQSMLNKAGQLQITTQAELEFKEKRRVVIADEMGRLSTELKLQNGNIDALCEQTQNMADQWQKARNSLLQTQQLNLKNPIWWTQRAMLCQ